MHHFGLRRRHEQTKEHRAHSKKPTRYVRILDKATLVIGVIGPVTVLPQIYSIFSTQSAEGVSAVTWFLMFLVTLPWVFYGAAHNDKTLIASFSLWEVVNLTVAVGAIIY